MANKHEACRCSHTRHAHTHTRSTSGTDCSLCDCGRFQSFRRHRVRHVLFWYVVMPVAVTAVAAGTAWVIFRGVTGG